MPLSAPLLSTNCIGGSVGLVDITSVPGLTSSEAATLGVQVWAVAAAASDKVRSRVRQVRRFKFTRLFFMARLL